LPEREPVRELRKPHRAPDQTPVDAARPRAGLARLVRANPDLARAYLSRLEPEQIADEVQALDPAMREGVLSIVEEPEHVVPLIAEAELATTIRATGLPEAGWLLEFATPEQRVACVDLDAWKGAQLSPARMKEWVDALIVAGHDTLAAALDDLDPELWVLLMRDMAEFDVVARDQDPPDGFTEDGVVYYVPHSEDDEQRLIQILRIAFSYEPERYWQMVYGAMFESQSECEEFALRWQRNRLNDLGFPDREFAMRIYQPLPVEQAPLVEMTHKKTGVEEMPRLPRRIRGSLTGRALAELPPDRASELLGYVLAVGNAVAIADRLPLAEPQSLEQALRKAITGIDRGLEALATARSQSPARVIDQTQPVDLFRVGVTLDPELRPDVSAAQLDEEDETPSWDLETVETDVEGEDLEAEAAAAAAAEEDAAQNR